MSCSRIAILALLICMIPQTLRAQQDTSIAHPRSPQFKLMEIDTTDDALSGCEIEPHRQPDIAFDYGWNMYPVESREVISWLGLSFVREFELTSPAESWGNFQLVTKIGGGLLYTLWEMALKYRFWSGLFFAGGMSLQFFFDDGDLGTYSYDYRPHVERSHLLQNLFLVCGIGWQDENNGWGFHVRVPLQKSVITPYPDYSMTGRPLDHIPPRSFIAFALSWEFQR